VKCEANFLYFAQKNKFYQTEVSGVTCVVLYSLLSVIEMPDWGNKELPLMGVDSVNFFFIFTVSNSQGSNAASLTLL